MHDCLDVDLAYSSVTVMHITGDVDYGGITSLHTNGATIF